MEADPPLFDECSANNRAQMDEANQKADRSKQMWEQLQKMYDNRDTSATPAISAGS